MLSKAEIDKRLFNILFETIMPQIYQLLEMPDQAEQDHGVTIANALHRLYCAITVIHRASDDWFKFYGEVEGKLSEQELRRTNFSNIDDMLTYSFSNYSDEIKSYRSNYSLIDAIKNHGSLGSTKTYELTINKLRSISIDRVFQQNREYHTDLYVVISMAERDKRLFNLLFETIMPKIYQLQESPYQHDHAHAMKIANALYRLYCAITIIHQTSEFWESFYGAVEGKLSSGQVQTIRFSSVHDMLECSFSTYNNDAKNYQFNYSLSTALNNGKIYGSTETHDSTINELRATHIMVLQQRRENHTVMHSYIYNSIVTAKSLCQLAKEGNLEGIKQLSFSRHEIDLIIDWSWRNVLRDTMTLYLGKYNALAVAVWYRRYPIIAYFIEAGADVNKRVGRMGTVTIEMCADIIPFISESHCRTCHEYLQRAKFFNPDKKASKSYSSVLRKNSFFPSPQDDKRDDILESGCFYPAMK